MRNESIDKYSSICVIISAERFQVCKLIIFFYETLKIGFVCKHGINCMHISDTPRGFKIYSTLIIYASALTTHIRVSHKSIFKVYNTGTQDCLIHNSCACDYHANLKSYTQKKNGGTVGL